MLQSIFYKNLNKSFLMAGKLDSLVKVLNEEVELNQKPFSNDVGASI